MVLEITSRHQGSGLCSLQIPFPQMTVVADPTRNEDELSLTPDYAVGNCHARQLPSVHTRHKADGRLTAECTTCGGTTERLVCP